LQVKNSNLIWFIVLLISVLIFSTLAPLEKTLGASVRIVYLHGAWVWTAILAFVAAALVGLAGLISRSGRIHNWSLALGRTGLFYWLTFLPMSLYVMQANWNGLFLDEPRFRIPLNLAIVALLLQAGLSFFPSSKWSSLANLAYGCVLFINMRGTQAILHPESPIFNSDARDIQLFFGALLLFLIASAWLLAVWWLSWEASRRSVAA
jgi:hypothetical protein